MAPMKLMLILDGLYQVSITISKSQIQSGIQNLPNEILMFKKLQALSIANEKAIQHTMTLKSEHLNNPALSSPVKDSIRQTMLESNETMRIASNNCLNSNSDLANNNIETFLNTAETTVRVAGDVTTYLLNHSSELTQFSQFSVSLLDGASVYAQYVSTVAPLLGC